MQQAQPPSGPRYTAFPAPELLGSYSADADTVMAAKAGACSLFHIDPTGFTATRTYTIGPAPAQQVGDLAIVQINGKPADTLIVEGVNMPSIGSIASSFLVFKYSALATWDRQFGAFGA